MKKNLSIARLFAALCFWWHTSWSAESDTVIIYPLIAADNLDAKIVIEGRVVERKSDQAFTQSTRRRDNLRRNAELMFNNERKHYPVTVRLAGKEWPLTTDQEGFFRVATNLNEVFTQPAAGWHVVTATTANGSGTGDLLIVPAVNIHGVISDIDDTIQITEVNSRRRMLSNTFLLNATQRSVVPGVADFYRQLVARNVEATHAPLIYLSASPKQLHTAVDAFLTHNQFPRGVLITKRVTDDATSDPIMDQVQYKTGKIESLLASLPHVKFTLVGDDGERDPEIYADIQARYPDRVEAVWIRRVHPDGRRSRFPGQNTLNDVLQEAAKQTQ